MRTLPEDMVSALTQAAAKLCHVWLTTRADGAVLGFTDHDRDLTFQGVLCQAQTALTQGASNQELGLSAPSSAAVSGIISSDALAAADIAAGLYDEAVIRFYTVDWTDPTVYVLTGKGSLAKLEARGGVDDANGQFIAHVEGPAAKLDRVIGRRFGFLCDAALGDARCGLTADIIAGRTCDKRYNTCLNTFANRLNFRGFPDLPGEDFLTVYPRSDNVMDGSSTGQSSGR